MVGRVISRLWSVRPLTLVVRIMGCRFGIDVLSVMTLVVALVALESEWVPGLARVSAAWDLMSKIRDLGWFRSSRRRPQGLLAETHDGSIFGPEKRALRPV